MTLTNQWTKNNGSTFVTEGSTIRVGRMHYFNVQPATLIQLGYIQKCIEQVAPEQLPSYTDGPVFYEDYQRNLYVHYEALQPEPEPEPENE